MNEEGRYRIDFQSFDSVGFYNKVVSFEVNPQNPEQITYKTVKATVYDSVYHVNMVNPLFKHKYINIPLSVGYKFFNKNNFTVSVETGVMFSKLLSSDIPTVEFNYPDYKLVAITRETHDRASINWQWTAGLNMQFKMKNGISLCLSPKFAKYITNIYISENKVLPYKDQFGEFDIRELRNRNIRFNVGNRPNLFYPFYVNPNKKDENGFYELSLEKREGWIKVLPKKSQGVQTVWRWGKERAQKELNVNLVGKKMRNGGFQIVEKYRKKRRMARSVWTEKEIRNEKGTLELKALFGRGVFDYPKAEELIKKVIEMGEDGYPKINDLAVLGSKPRKIIIPITNLNIGKT